MYPNHLADPLDGALHLTPRAAAIALALITGIDRPLPRGWHEAVSMVLAHAADDTKLTDTDQALYAATATRPDLWSAAGRQDDHVGLARTWFVSLRLNAQRQRFDDL